MRRKRSLKDYRHEVYTLTLKEVYLISIRSIRKDRNLWKGLDIVVHAWDIRVWETKTEFLYMSFYIGILLILWLINWNRQKSNPQNCRLKILYTYWFKGLRESYIKISFYLLLCQMSPSITEHCGHCRKSDLQVGDVIIELENQIQGQKLNVGVSEA